MRYRRTLVGLLFAIAISAAAVVPVAAAQGSTTETTYTYTMRLSPARATVRAGHSTRTTITFSASRRLHGAQVDLSVVGLPSGVTASFSPATPRIGGRSTLTLTAAPSSSTGNFALTVSAITQIFPSDPIGTTSGFDLSISSR